MMFHLEMQEETSAKSDGRLVVMHVPQLNKHHRAQFCTSSRITHTSTVDGRQRGSDHNTAGPLLPGSCRRYRDWWPCRLSWCSCPVSWSASLHPQTWVAPAESGFAARDRFRNSLVKHLPASYITSAARAIVGPWPWARARPCEGSLWNGWH